MGLQNILILLCFFSYSFSTDIKATVGEIFVISPLEVFFFRLVTTVPLPLLSCDYEQRKYVYIDKDIFQDK